MKGKFNRADRGGAIIVESLDGRAYVGETLSDALNAMRAAAWGCPGKSNMASYRKAVAYRVTQWNKAFVRTDSDEVFAEDLEAAGIITVRHIQ